MEVLSLKTFHYSKPPMGDYQLSPAYDLLNSRIHIDDKDFALQDGLLPMSLVQRKISKQFVLLDEKAEINKKIYERIISQIRIKSELVQKLIAVSFLYERIKRNYWQTYLGQLKQLLKG